MTTKLGLGVMAGILLLTLYPACASAQTQVEAFTGNPFGVGRVTLTTRETAEDFSISDRQGRALYPAPESRPVRGAIRNALGLNRPRAVNLYFLFRGNEPLDLALAGPVTGKLKVMPVRNAAAHGQLIDGWWKAYRAPTRIWNQSDDYPPQVENYLTTMLARRLDLRIGERRLGLLEGDTLGSILGPLLGTEDARITLERKIMLGQLDPVELATLALPETVTARSDPTASGGEGGSSETPPLEIDLGQPGETTDESPPAEGQDPPAKGEAGPELIIPLEVDPGEGAEIITEADVEAAKVEIEPLAFHVPAECFYLRFGSFSNFRWLGATLQRAGGDLGSLVTVRGLESDLKSRIERQLALRETELTKVLGDMVVGDVALIGSDAFFHEGASFGVLFETHASESLAASFHQQRLKTLEQRPDATLTDVEIAGHEVSFLSTPDNAVRSYHAVTGDMHFVSTSETLVRRFFEAGEGQQSLGQAEDFERARRRLPVKRRDTVFLYLSDAFLREIASPRYRVEMGRRLHAVAELELVELARLAARAEGRPAESIEDLIAAGLLPQQFGQRPDGSQTKLENGVAYDTLRGQRGSFLPAADMQVTTASAQELAEYEAFAEYSQSKWEQLEPVALAVKRRLREGGRERVAIEAHLSPTAADGNSRLKELIGQLAGQFLGGLGGLGAESGTPLDAPSVAGMVLGPPMKERLVPIRGDIISAELALGDQMVFAGLRDVELSAASPLSGLIPKQLMDRPLLSFLTQSPDFLVGYLGGTPPGGPAQKFFDKGNFGPPNPQGYSASTGPLVRREFNDMLVYSLHPGVLEEVTPKLRYEPAERPAQFRLHVEDLQGTELGQKIDTISYSRARRTSEGNAHFLDSLVQQLHVPHDECLALAESMLDARPVCPLGGDYTLGGGGTWVSTAWTGKSGPGDLAMPAGYQSPPLRWFRGLDADATLIDGHLALFATLETQLPEKATGPQPEIIPLPEAHGDDPQLDIQIELPPEALP